MKEKWNEFKTQITTFWQKNSKKQKIMYITVISILLVAIIGITIFRYRNNYGVLSYTNAAIQEVAEIKEELHSRNVDYEIENEETIITVPEKESEKLLIDLAGQGIPHNGSIDYSFFSENASFGVTDNEFNMMKLDAMQTERANLITR